jgi:hypothetical protein
MNKLFKKIPIDVIKIILSYDRRFIIRKNDIITIDILDLKKYKNINKLLFNNLLKTIPKPIMKNIRHSEGKKWFYYEIKFKTKFKIYYHVDYMGNMGDIYFVMFKNIINSIFIVYNTTIATMKIE